jgi:hypothetical protein
MLFIEGLHLRSGEMSGFDGQAGRIKVTNDNLVTRQRIYAREFLESRTRAREVGGLAMPYPIIDGVMARSLQADAARGYEAIGSAEQQKGRG